MDNDYNVEKTLLFFDPYVDEDAFDDVMLEAAYIVDIMWAYGYAIPLRDAYRAWLYGNNGVWENPFDYSDDIIVSEILAQTGVERKPFLEDDAISNPFFDEWLESELEDYEPMENAQVEGSDYS